MRFSRRLSIIPIATSLCVSLFASTPAIANGGPCPDHELDPDTGEYLISDRGDLESIDDGFCLDESFRLTADIDLSGGDWTPIDGFYGSINGDGHTISGLMFDDELESDVGLVNVDDPGASFSDLSFDDVNIVADSRIGTVVGLSAGPITFDRITVTGMNIEGSSSFAGGLIGVGEDTVIISDSSVDGEIWVATSSVGGLVGAVDSDITIINSSSSGSASGQGMVGGLGGHAAGIADISNSTSTMDITGTDSHVGGLLGVLEDSGTITDAEASNTISGDDFVGGLIGYAGDDLAISESSHTGDIVGTDEYVGGLVGVIDGELIVTESSSTGDISGVGFVGGLVGSLGGDDESTLSDVRVNGLVESTDTYVGGLVGVASGLLIIDGADAAGGVIGINFTGGLVGSAMGGAAIEDASVNGDVAGGEHVGGLVGTADTPFEASAIDITSDVTGTGNFVGGLAGYLEPGATVSLISISIAGDIEGISFVGGLIGSVDASLTGRRIEFAGGLTGGTFVGGLIGSARATTFNNIVVEADVETTSTFAGGVIGTANGDVELTRLVFSGDVDALGFSSLVLGSGNGSFAIDDFDVSGHLIADGSFAGAIAGSTIGDTTIENGTVSGSMDDNESDSSFAGGLIGSVLDTTTVRDVTVELDIEFGGFTGGFFGASGDLTIDRSSFEGDIDSSGTFNGGFSGTTNGAIDVTDSFVSSALTAGLFTGGLSGSVNGTASVNRTYFMGSVATASVFTGGLFGTANGSSTVDDVFVQADITGQDFTGGFIGSQNGTLAITNAYVLGDVSGEDFVGGFAGSVTGDSVLDSTYLRGDVSGAGFVNSFVGGSFDPDYENVGGTAFWSIDACGACSDEIGSGIPDISLQDRDFLRDAGWEFTRHWCISTRSNSGFPVLRDLPTGPINFANCFRARSRLALRTFVLDPNGGDCSGNVAPWAIQHRGPIALPTSTECQKPGSLLVGWERTLNGTGTGVIRRVEASAPGTLRAVWVNAPGTPTQVNVFANFLCDRCTSIWIWWQPPAEGSADIIDYTVEDGPGNVVCTVPAGSWTMCLLGGLQPGSTHDLVVRGRNFYGSGPGVPVSVHLS